MARIPAELRYSDQHAWARQEPDGTVAVGITAFLRQRIGEIVFVQQPPLGDVLKAGDPAGTVETVDSVADVFAPVGGTVCKVNQDVDGDPDSVNGAPYSAWLFKLLPGDPDDYGKLFDARGYQELLDSE